MRIIWHTPYISNTRTRIPDPVWPEGWPIPRKGECIELPNHAPMWVHGVDYYPHGDGEGSDPFVYIALSMRAHP